MILPGYQAPLRFVTFLFEAVLRVAFSLKPSECPNTKQSFEDEEKRARSISCTERGGQDPRRGGNGAGSVGEGVSRRAGAGRGGDHERAAPLLNLIHEHLVKNLSIEREDFDTMHSGTSQWLGKPTARSTADGPRL